MMLARLIRLIRPSWRRDVQPFVRDVRQARARGQKQQRASMREVRALRERRQNFIEREWLRNRGLEHE